VSCALENERGFTLIELVIIIILLGVLAAIAIPRYVDLRDNAVRAAAQATLEAGRAAVSFDYVDQMAQTGGYTYTLTNDTTNVPGEFEALDVTDLENELPSRPNYPPNGPYDDPNNKGFRWWLVTQGSSSPPQPPVIDGLIDVTCADTDSAKNKANDDCWASKL
jgi:prepilin-type N-terminal cleavage/methylation domain-containing protein